MWRFGAVACYHCFGWFESAGWSFSAEARRRRVVPRRVTLVSVSCVRAWPRSMGRIQMCWSWVCWQPIQSTRSTMVSWRPFPGVARAWRPLTVSVAELSCRQYQPRGVSRALPWRFAGRRSGSLMVAGVRGGCPCPGGVWRGGMSRSGLSTSICAWSCAWLGCAVPGGPVGEMLVVLGCHRCLWRRGLVVGVPPGRAGGVLKACRRR